MTVKFKKLNPKAVTPCYSKQGDAGLDLTAISRDIVSKGDYEYVQYGTGLAIEIPEGYVGLLFPRSSVSTTGLHLANSVGVVDSNYRGEVCLRFKRIGWNATLYNIGERVGQIMIVPYPQIELEQVEELSSTNRGDGGFGSSGK